MGYIVYATSFFELEDQKKYVDKLIVPSYFDSFDLTTKMPVYELSVYKISKVYNKLTYKVILQDNYDISKEINTKLVRGSTSWEGKGDYTGNKKYIIPSITKRN